MYLTDTLSAECCQLLQNGVQLKTVMSNVVNNIWIKSLICQYLISI